MRKYILSTVCFAALMLSGGIAKAQDNYLGGATLSGYEFGIFDMLTLSQHNTALTTARATAMGGAFTSLGGDLSSMSINPAGIAMYRGGAWGFSPAMNFSNTGSNIGFGSSARNRFSINNIGMVMNTYRGSGSLTNVNFGFSYNKLADFNNTISLQPGAGPHSLADIFTAQLNGLTAIMNGNLVGGRRTLYDLNNNPHHNESIGLNEWGALLAFQSGIIAPRDPGDMNQLYYVDGIAGNALVLPTMVVDTRGSVGEYNFTLGMNFSNKLYVGAGVTVQDIYMRRKILYDESYLDNNSGSLRSMWYDQYIKMSGTGINFKVGVTYRPVMGLRIGLAVHTPTWTSLTHEYNATMRAESLLSTGTSTSNTPLNTYSYNYNSPTRLLAGISYTLGDFAAIALDYERVWYNGIRLTSENHWVREDFRAQATETFKPGNNVKVGFEFKPTDMVALRAGYSYYSAPVDSGYFYTQPITSRTHNISAGVGFRLGAVTSLDLAYVYSNNKYSDFDIFYYHGDFRNDVGTIVNTGNNPITTQDSPIDDLILHRHTAVLSLSFAF